MPNTYRRGVRNPMTGMVKSSIAFIRTISPPHAIQRMGACAASEGRSASLPSSGTSVWLQYLLCHAAPVGGGSPSGTGDLRDILHRIHMPAMKSNLCPPSLQVKGHHVALLRNNSLRFPVEAVYCPQLKIMEANHEAFYHCYSCWIGDRRIAFNVGVRI
jgi:hypothetical protein